jgi:hypothetical protein
VFVPAPLVAVMVQEDVLMGVGVCRTAVPVPVSVDEIHAQQEIRVF